MANEDDDDFEDRPRRRRRRPDEDDELEEQPRRRARDEDDDEEDDYDDRDPGSRRLHRDELRAIAMYQKAILLCILAYFALVAVQFAIPEENRLYLLIGLAPLALASTVFVFMLSTQVYTTATGVVLGILTLIPCIGLIVLLVINQKATTIMKKHRIRVGLLGARMSDI